MCLPSKLQYADYYQQIQNLVASRTRRSTAWRIVRSGRMRNTFTMLATPIHRLRAQLTSRKLSRNAPSLTEDSPVEAREGRRRHLISLGCSSRVYRSWSTGPTTNTFPHTFPSVDMLKLVSYCIPSVSTFSKNVQLVFSNAMGFNPGGSQIHGDTRTLKVCSLQAAVHRSLEG